MIGDLREAQQELEDTHHDIGHAAADHRHQLHHAAEEGGNARVGKTVIFPTSPLLYNTYN